METLGAASAATLGFIAGDLPGAYLGYKAYRGYRAMPPIKRKFYSRRPTGVKKFRGLPRFNVRQKNSITTQQHDYSNQYRKRVMPRRKKRIWKKFVKKVQAVGFSERGLKTVVFNGTQTSTAVATAQTFFCAHLYGVYGDTDTSFGIGRQDLVRLYSNDPSVQQNVGPTNPKLGKLMFGSAVLDITIRNIGEYDSEVDVYYCTHVKNNINSNMSALGGNAEVDLPINGGVPNTTLSLTTRGCTVFDLPAAISVTGLHILRKQKILMTPGRSVFLQQRDAKNRSLDWSYLRQSGCANRKLTQTIIVVHKTSTGAPAEAQSILSFGVTRKYAYQEIANTKDMTALNP